ncbi:11759_t:CDS:1, partial [Racocetra fulgida]
VVIEYVSEYDDSSEHEQSIVSEHDDNMIHELDNQNEHLNYGPKQNISENADD